MAIERPLFVIPLPFTVHGTGNAKSNRPASYLAQPRYPGLVWQSDGNSNLWVRGQFASAQDIDFVSLIQCNAGTTSKLRVRLGTSQAEVDGTAPYDSAAQTIRSPAVTRDSGRYHSHLDMGSATSATWFRIDISDHTGDFEAATIVFGKKVQALRYYDSNFEFGAEDLSNFDISVQGVPTIEEGLVLRSLNFRLSWVSAAEYEASFRRIIERLGKSNVIYVCFDPDAAAARNDKTYLGWLRQLPAAIQQRKPLTYGIEFAIRSLI